MPKHATRAGETAARKWGLSPFFLNNRRMRTRIGDPVPRTEDPILLRGEGRYTDDLNEPGQAYACMVRSPHAHGFLWGIDSEKAKTMPGVLAVYTGKDLASYGTHKCQLQLPNLKKPPRRS